MSWDERYSRGEHVGMTPMRFLVELAARLHETGEMLDLACGSGRHSVLFAEKGWKVTAVDSSGVALGMLRERDPRVTCVQADLEVPGAYDLGVDRWDLVVVTMYLQRSLFPLIRQAVRVGGRVAMAIPLEDPREGVRAMNPAFLLRGVGELEVEFPGWTVELARETNPDPPGRRVAEFVAVR